MGRHSWDEAEHPRDPRSGEFTDKPGGWAGRVASRLGKTYDHHVRGRNRSRTVLSQQFRKRAAKINEDMGYEDGDTVLAEVMKLQGWDAPSRTGTDQELDDAIAQGGVELWRGYKGQVPELWGWGPNIGKRAPFHPEASPMARAQQTIDGPLWVGTGIYANGWYVSVDQKVAQHYGMKMWSEQIPTPTEQDLAEHRAKWGEYADQAGPAVKRREKVLDYTDQEIRDLFANEGPAPTKLVYEYEQVDPRTVQRMVLSPDARIVDYGSEELADFVKQAGGGGYVSRHGSGEAGRGSGPLQEYGAAAAALGYDAIRVVGRGDGSGRNADQYVILNRTAMLFGQPYDESGLPSDVTSFAQWQAARSP